MNTCATGRCGDFVVISRSFLGCTNDGQIWSNTIIVVLLTTCVHSGCGLAGMAAGGGNYDLTCNRGGVASGGVAVTNDMCSYTTTTHTRDHSYYPLFHIHHTPHTNRPTQSRPADLRSFLQADSDAQRGTRAMLSDVARQGR